MKLLDTNPGQDSRSDERTRASGSRITSTNSGLMPKRKYFRRIYLDEIAAVHNKLKAKYPDGALPDWRNVFVQVESVGKQEKILALVEFDQRTCINTLDADSPVAARDIINWADGYLGDYPQDEFQVPDTNT